MNFELPKLPFIKDELKPFISEETIEYHYNKHHQTYVTNLNKLIIGTEFINQSLLDIIKSSSGTIFNNAAQHWNHSFYWNCLQPKSEEKLSTALIAAIKQSFGSLENFKEEFTKSALSLFGSGWTWLVKNQDGNLSILNTSNAENPLLKNHIPLLVCDVWEHAYYIDYRNARAKYLENFWHIVNWRFVSDNLAQI
jgi:superoxide dismutase, Fe-Mn family